MDEICKCKNRTEHYFPVVLFMMLYKVDDILKGNIQMKAIEHYFSVLLLLISFFLCILNILFKFCHFIFNHSQKVRIE